MYFGGIVIIALQVVFVIMRSGMAKPNPGCSS
jgi:hypothetical protein